MLVTSLYYFPVEILTRRKEPSCQLYISVLYIPELCSRSCGVHLYHRTQTSILPSSALNHCWKPFAFQCDRSPREVKIARPNLLILLIICDAIKLEYRWTVVITGAIHSLCIYGYGVFWRSESVRVIISLSRAVVSAWSDLVFRPCCSEIYLSARCVWINGTHCLDKWHNVYI